jgi:hypothetical protein
MNDLKSQHAIEADSARHITPDRDPSQIHLDQRFLDRALTPPTWSGGRASESRGIDPRSPFPARAAGGRPHRGPIAVLVALRRLGGLSVVATHASPASRSMCAAGNAKGSSARVRGLRCDELTGNIRVWTERDAVVLSYRVRGLLDAVWKSIERRVPLTWTACHFGGKRPWFVCSVCANGRYCGRRVAVLYLAGDSFACRRCYGLAYESQQGGLLFPQDDDCRRAAF